VAGTVTRSLSAQQGCVKSDKRAPCLGVGVLVKQDQVAEMRIACLAILGAVTRGGVADRWAERASVAAGRLGPAVSVPVKAAEEAVVKIQQSSTPEVLEQPDPAWSGG